MQNKTANKVVTTALTVLLSLLIAAAYLAVVSWVVMYFLGVANSINPIIPALGYLETAVLVGITWIVLPGGVRSR